MRPPGGAQLRPAKAGSVQTYGSWLTSPYARSAGPSPEQQKSLRKVSDQPRASRSFDVILFSVPGTPAPIKDRTAPGRSSGSRLSGFVPTFPGCPSGMISTPTEYSCGYSPRITSEERSLPGSLLRLGCQRSATKPIHQNSMCTIRSIAIAGRDPSDGTVSGRHVTRASDVHRATCDTEKPCARVAA